MRDLEAAHEERIRRLFRRHLWLYLAANGTLLTVNVVVGGGWWSFWPLFAWGVPLAVHYFYYKSVTVEDAWVEERADDLKLRSYDLGHIQDIQARVEERDATVRPGDEREDA